MNNDLNLDLFLTQTIITLQKPWNTAEESYLECVIYICVWKTAKRLCSMEEKNLMALEQHEGEHMMTELVSLCELSL